MEYYCDCCNYTTHKKYNFEKHVSSKKHIKSTKNQLKVNKILTQSQQFICKYCLKNFTTKQSMYRHIKYTCKENKDEDLKELVRLLNEQNMQMLEQQEKMQKQIDKLTKKLQMQQIGTQNNSYTTQNNIVNYMVNSYVDTDYSHLTDNDYIKCIKDTNHCVKSLIEKVHFNKKKPENMNIYIPSLKDSYIMVYKKGEWLIQDRKEILDDLYEKNEWTLESWYEEYKDNYPDIIKSFEKYLQNKEEDDVVNDVKKKILIDLYNKRDIVLSNKTDTEISI